MNKKNMYKKLIVITFLFLTINTAAMKRKHEDYTQAEFDKINKKMNLHYAAKKGRTNTIKNLLPLYDINEKNSKEETPLFVAIKHNQKEAADLLLENGAKTDAYNEHGQFPLGQAIENESCECTTLLLEKGADPFMIERHLYGTGKFYHAETPPYTTTENSKFMVFLHSTSLRASLNALLYWQQPKNERRETNGEFNPFRDDM